jgi:hypothetical protein
VSTFYVVSSGAAATLVGLLFVAVQIGPPLVGAGPISRRHAMARSTFSIFAILFALSLYLLLPNQGARARALVVLAAALGGTYRTVKNWLPVWRDKLEGRIEFRLWQTAWLVVAPVLAYLYLAYGGIAQLRASDPTIVDQDAPGMFIILFVIGVRNAWSLLVEAGNPPPRPAPTRGEGNSGA